MPNPGVTDLIGWWRMDEMSGIRYDSHGSNNLTATNNPLYGAGKRGKAVNLVAASSQELGIADNSEISMGGDVSFSIGLWFKSHDVSINQRLIGKWNESGTKEYMLSIYNSRVWFYVRDSTGTTSYSVQAVTFGDLSDDTWYYAHGHYNDGTDTIAVGVNDIYNSTTNAPTTGIHDSNNSLYFGRDGSGIYYLDGMIDEVYLYKRRLNTGERTWLYNSGHGRTYSEITEIAPPPIDIITTPTAGRLLIHVLDTSLDVIGILEDYYSLTWAERYAEVGDFELELPIEHTENSIIDFGNFLYVKNSEALMIIEDIKPSIGEEQSRLVVRGQSAESFLKRRVLLDPSVV
jgi:hypothetical protein